MDWQSYFSTAKAFAQSLGVAESTVSGWIKAATYPAYAEAFLTQLACNAELKRRLGESARDIAALKRALRLIAE